MLFIKNCIIPWAKASSRGLLFGPSFRFSSEGLHKVLRQLEGRMEREQIVQSQVEESILKNYLQLTEESYLGHLLQQQQQARQERGKIDPRVVLMILPTLSQGQAIKQHLFFLYPHLNALRPRELQLFLQYLLAHKIKPLPKLPNPKSLSSAESLLVLLGELYPRDELVEWLGQIPLYSGDNLYMLAMGAFGIVGNLSEEVQLREQKVIGRCFERIYELWEREGSQVRVGVIILALEAGLPIAEQFLLQHYSVQFQQVDGLKLGLLLVELNSYLNLHYGQVKAVGPREEQEEEEDVDIDEGVDRKKKREEPTRERYVYDSDNLGEVKFQLQKKLLTIARFLRRQEWNGIVKLHQMVGFYGVIRGKKMEGEWKKFAFKLFAFTTTKRQATAMANLGTGELIGMLEAVEGLKINRPDLVKQLLVLLSDRLEGAEARELVRLSKCLVTYVRLCEDYLIHFRKVIERRKFIFSYQDVQTLNLNFQRVKVLFPQPLLY